MSTTIDERVVSMKFDNQQFESGVKTSLNTLDKLKTSLDFNGSVKGLENVNKSINSIDVSPMSDAIQTVQAKISMLDVATATVVARMTNSIIDGAKSIGSAITSQIISGGKSRALNIRNAKFQLEGLGVAWKDIESDISFGVDQTAYGLDSAAVAASQLVASNVKLGNSVRTVTDSTTGETKSLDSMAVALKAISGVAAMTNSDYDSIASIFTTVAGQGKLMTMQLRQLESRGLNAAAKLGEVLGKTESQVRDMVTNGEIDFNTFSEAMYDAFGEHASEANKTFTGALSNMKSALSRIGELFAGPIYDNMIGPLNSLRIMFNKVKVTLVPLSELFTRFATNIGKYFSQVIDTITAGIADDKNNVISEIGRWATYAEGSVGGLVDMMKIVNNIFNFFVNIIKQVRLAFLDVFPKKTAEEMKTISGAVADFTDGLKLSEDTLNSIRSTFRGVFSVLKVAVSLIKALWKLFSPILSALKPILSYIVKITGYIGAFITKISDIISEAGLLDGTLSAIGLTLAYIIQLVSHMMGIVTDFLGKDAITSTVKTIIKVLNSALIIIFKVVESVVKFIGTIILLLKNLVIIIIDGVVKAINAITQAISNLIVNTQKIASSGVPVILAFFQSVLEQIKKGLEDVNKVFRSIVEGFKQSKIGQLIDDIHEKIKGLFKTAEDGSKKLSIGEKIKNIGEKFKEAAVKVWNFAKSIDYSKVVALLYSGVLGYLGFRMATLMSDIGDLSRASANFLIAVTNKINNFSFSTTKAAPKVNGFVETIVALTAALYILSTVPEEDLKKATKYVLIISGIIAVLETLSFVFNKFGKVLQDGESMTDVSKMLISFTISLAALIGVYKLLEKVNLEDSQEKMYALMQLIALMSLALGSVSVMCTRTISKDKTLKLSTGALTIIALAFAIEKLVNAFNTINNADYSKVEQSVSSLTKLFVSLGVLAFGASNLNIGGVLAFVILAKSLGALVDPLQQIATIRLESTDGAIQQILDTLTEMTAIVAVATALGVIFGGKKVKYFTSGILTLSIAFAALIACEKLAAKLEMQPFSDASKALWELTGMVGLLSLCASKLQNVNVLGFAVMLGSFANTLAILIGLAAIITKIGINKLDDGLFILGVLTIIISIATAIAGSKSEGSLSTFIGLIILLGEAMGFLVVLSNFDTVSILSAAISIAVIFGELAGILASLNKIDSSKIKGVLPSLMVVIGGIAAVLIVVSKSDDRAVNALVAAISIGAVLGVLLILLKEIAKMTFIDETADILSQVIGIITVLGAVIITISALKAGDEAIEAAVAIAAVLGVMSYLLKTISGPGLGNNATAANKVKTLNAITKMLAVLAVSLLGLSGIGLANPMAILASTAGLSLCLISLAESLKIISGIHANNSEILKKITMLIPLIASIGVIGGVLSLLGKMNWSSALSAAIAVSAVMASMALLLNSVNKITQNSAPTTVVMTMGAIGMACIAVLSIGNILASIASQPWQGMLAAAGSVSIVIAAIVGMLVVLNNQSTIIAAGPNTLAVLAGAALAICGVGASLSLLQNIPWEQLRGEMISISLTMLALVGVMVILEKFKISWNTIGEFAVISATFGAAIYVIAVACQQLETIDWEQVKKGVSSIVTLAVVLGLLTVAVASFKTGGIVALLAVVGAFIALSVAAMLLSDSVTEMNNSLGNGLTTAKDALVTFQTVVTQLLSLPLDTLITTISSVLNCFSDFASEMENVNTSFSEAVVSIYRSVLNLSTAASLASNSMAALFNNMSSSISKNRMKLHQEGASLGAFVVEGIVVGMKIKETELTKEVQQVANHMKETFCNALGIHSPSKVFQQYGEYSTQGYAKGLTDSASKQVIQNGVDESAKIADDKASDDYSAVGSDASVSQLTSYSDTLTDDTNKQVLVDANNEVATDAGNELINTSAEEGMEAGVMSIASASEAAKTQSGNLINLLWTVGQSAGSSLVNGIIDGITAGCIDLIANYGELLAEIGSATDWTWDDDWGFDQATLEEMRSDAQGYRDEALANINEAGATVLSNLSDIEESIYNVADAYGIQTESLDLFTASAEDDDKITGILTQTTDSLSNSLSDTGSSSSSSSTELKGLAKILDTLKTNVTSTLSGFEKFEASITNTKDRTTTLTKNLKSQITGVSTWSDDILRAAQKGISEPILEELVNLGTEGYDTLVEFLQMTDEEIEEYNTQYAARSDLLTKSTTGNIKVIAALAKAGNAEAIASLSALGISIEQVEEVMGENTYTVIQGQEAYDELKESVKDAISIFEEFDFTTETTSKEILDNMKSQVEGMSEWATDLYLLAEKGLSKDIIQMLADEGVESYDNVRAFMTMSQKEIEQANETYAESLTISDTTATMIMAAMAKAGDEAAQAYISSLEDGTEAIDLTTLSNTLNGVNQNYTKIREAVSKTKEMFSELTDTISNQIDMFSEFDTSTEVSGEEMLNNMKSQIEGITKWKDNLLELQKRGISDNLFESLSELGPEGYEKVAAFVDMTDEQLREANDLFAQSLTLPQDSAGDIISSYGSAGIQALNETAKSIEESGNNIIAGLVKGMEESQYMATNAGKALGTATIEVTDEALGVHSPSKFTYDSGMNTVLGLANGLSDYVSVSNTEAAGVGISAIGRISKYFNIDRGTNLGSNLCKGLISGLNNGLTEVVDAARSMAQAAYEAARSALDINSPSKKFEFLGYHSATGYAQGVLNNLGVIKSAQEQAGTTAVDTLRNTLSHISDVAVSDITDPVIRPTLDLSGVRAGARSVNSMFNAQEIGVNANTNGQNQNGGNTTGGVTFNQYNYSPKALDRIEIYRQTSNQVSQMKGAMA